MKFETFEGIKTELIHDMLTEIKKHYICIDTGTMICECWSKDMADKITEALNSYYKK